MKYNRESLNEFYSDAMPLLEMHYKEIAHYKDIKLSVDLNAYGAIEEAGYLRIYTIREEQELIGYGVFFIKNNPHYKESLQAVQDVIFIRPDKRGQGREFISWCDNQLKSEGIDVVYHHVKAAHNFGPMLERQGYELIDLIYGKRL